MTREIYLDHNATAPMRPQVADLVLETMAMVGNPSSVHDAGRRARARVELAREQVAALVGALPDQVIFTSGGTESNNLALKGFGPRHLLVSAIEHGAVLAPALLSDPNCAVIAVDAEGVIDLADLDRALQAETAAAGRPMLVSLMLANNETGVIQPVAEAAALAHEHGALVHCDAVQGAGKIAIDMTALGIDMLSLSAHKIGGPQGVGALILRADNVLRAQQVGGGQERGRRSGTENVAGIAGFGAAAEAAVSGLGDFAALADERDRLEQALRSMVQETRVLGAGAPRLANTSCVTMPGVGADIQVMAFDLEGIRISAGSACSSGKVAASHVLDAMGLDEDEANTAVRISMGWNSQPGDVDRFIAAWQTIHGRAADQAAKPSRSAQALPG